MSLLDGLFGAGAQQAMLGGTTQQSNQAYNNYQSQASNQQSLSQAFNQTMMNWNQNPFARTSQWVFAGTPCTLEEFADRIWGAEPHEDKMLFLLTHSGPECK